VVITLLSFLVVIGVLVFVHELGHLIAAKSVDIECPRFSIGFGPRIAGFHWGETEYVISLLPLGGYVRMAGMEDTAALEGGAEPEREPSPRDFDAKPIWARIVVVIAGVVMNFLFAIVTVAAVALVLGEPVNPSTRVAVVAPGSNGPGSALAAVPQGAELTAVGDERVTTWDEVGDALLSAPAGPVTLRFSNAGPVTLQLPAGDSARAALLAPIQPYTHAVIGEVSPGSPAARDGMQEGDSIVSAEGAPIRSWSEFVEVVRDHPDRSLALVVKRGGAPHPLTVTPDAETEKDPEGRSIRVGKLGVAPQITIEHRPLGPVASLQRGWRFTWNTSAEIVHLLGDLLTGAASPRNLGGALTIGQISGQAARAGMEVFLQWMALLSVNLAVLNLLPIPVLDGGQLLFLIVEGLRGRPLSVEQRLRLSHVGLIIVVGLMVWAITNDVLRLFGI
jgi:regulator of sigma E protease